MGGVKICVSDSVDLCVHIDPCEVGLRIDSDTCEFVFLSVCEHLHACLSAHTLNDL